MQVSKCESCGVELTLFPGSLDDPRPVWMDQLTTILSAEVDLPDGRRVGLCRPGTTAWTDHTPKRCREHRAGSGLTP